MHKKISISLFLLITAILVGCSGTPSGRVTSNYDVRGMLFHNLNDSSSFGYAYILNDGEPVTALVSYIVTGPEDSTQLDPIGGGAYLSPLGELTLEPDSSYYFWAGEDFGDFYFSKQLRIADTFKVEITNLPPTREYGGSGPVTLEWHPPSQDFDYFITVVPPNDNAQPYWSFTETETIPYDAFTTSDGIRVPGTYFIYVIAYYETFYSDAVVDDADYTFFPYPDSGFVNNIDLVDIKGRFGAATASYRDSVVVIEQTK